jgi:hypothetical protein
MLGYKHEYDEEATNINSRNGYIFLMNDLKGYSPRMCEMIRFSGDDGSIRRNLYADVSLNRLQGVEVNVLCFPAALAASHKPKEEDCMCDSITKLTMLAGLIDGIYTILAHRAACFEHQRHVCDLVRKIGARGDGCGCD